MRLIDADALLEELDKVEDQLMGYKYALIDTRIVVGLAPTIDAEPVVRCKDCKWWSGCRILDDENGYCSEGERKDDE